MAESAQAPSVRGQRRLNGFTNRALYAMWQALSQHYGLPRPRKSELYSMHWTPALVKGCEDIRPPIMHINEYGSIWIDRYYVAFDLKGTTQYTYAAISKYELAEEIQRIKELYGETDARKAILLCPNPLRLDLLEACRHMHNTRSTLWLNPRISAMGTVAAKGKGRKHDAYV